ncbi:MAG: TetR/AcrR family transcriptional regulator [Proteobacteria bacterium]|nr:TetR/AcrR family transcriptional regulator [Pseudomonadota bacterium]
MIEMDGRKLGTKDRILAAASDVFAEFGFEKATVRDICSRAGANVAAVNYHFRDKKDLFLLVLSAWKRSAQEQYPLDMGLGEDAGDELLIGAFYRSMLRRILLATPDSTNSYRRAKVFMHQLSDGLFRDLEEGCENHRQMFEHLAPIVGRLLGKAAPTELNGCLDSIIGQVLTYFVGYVMDPNEFQSLRSEEEIDRVARHMTLFTLGGIRAVKESLV